MSASDCELDLGDFPLYSLSSRDLESAVFQSKVSTKLLNWMSTALRFKMDAQSTFPVTKKGAVLLDGKHVDVVMTTFEDKLLLVITQYQKFGTLVHVTRDNLPLDKREEIYSTQVLLGNDEPVTHVFARKIAKHVLKTQSKPLLLSIALEDYTPAMLKGIEKVIEDYVI